MRTFLFIYFAANMAHVNGVEYQVAPSEYIVVTESGEHLVKGSAQTVTDFLQAQGYTEHSNILNCWVKG